MSVRLGLKTIRLIRSARLCCDTIECHLGSWSARGGKPSHACTLRTNQRQSMAILSQPSTLAARLGFGSLLLFSKIPFCKFKRTLGERSTEPKAPMRAQLHWRSASMQRARSPREWTPARMDGRLAAAAMTRPGFRRQSTCRQGTLPLYWCCWPVRTTSGGDQQPSNPVMADRRCPPLYIRRHQTRSDRFLLSIVHFECFLHATSLVDDSNLCLVAALIGALVEWNQVDAERLLGSNFAHNIK